MARTPARTRARTRSTLALLALVGSILAVAGAPVTPAGADTTYSLAIRPGLLRDGQVIDFHVSGATSTQNHTLIQCAPAGVPDPCDLDVRRVFRIEPSGVHDSVFRVAAILTTGGGEVDCRTVDPANPCTLVLEAPYPDFAPVASVPLAFAPGGPLRQDPRMTVTPTHNLADGQAVDVMVRNLDPGDHVHAYQCASDLTRCRYGSKFLGLVDDAGVLRHELQVHRSFTSDLGEAVDCSAPESCSVYFRYGWRWQDGSDSYRYELHVPLTFTPA